MLLWFASYSRLAGTNQNYLGDIWYCKPAGKAVRLGGLSAQNAVYQLETNRGSDDMCYDSMASEFGGNSSCCGSSNCC